MQITNASGIIASGRTLAERQVASASIIKGKNHTLVATAAHCIYDLNRIKYHENILFSISEDVEVKYRPMAVAIPKDFVENTYLEYDTCFLVMEERFNTVEAYRKAALEVAFNLPKNLRYSIYGYPNESNLIPAKAEGKAVKDTYKNSSLQGVSCFEKDGMSGGPWITTYKESVVQNSLSILSMNSVENIMWGPYWGKVIECTYKAADELQLDYPDVQLHFFSGRR